ncbi:MAG: glycosyltransferase family 2 protein [Pyrinomonadaceae bacterium]
MSFSENGQVKLSIVIAAWNGVEMLRECLISLENQIESANAEIIVVSNFANGIEKNASEFPFARHIILPADATLPELRARGIFESNGAIIALGEDICAFDSDWCREILKAHESKYSIVGGAVENAGKQNSLDWAVYFYDYGKYMPPNQARIIDALSEMNISYKREILERLRENYADGFFETFINEELKRRGYELYLQPSAIVFHRKNYELRKVVSQFYHQARSFAARRVFNFPFSKRLFFIAASLLLPVLLPVRVISRTIGKGRRFGKLIISLPYLVILTSVWAFGEFCGYLNDEGTSGRDWK